MPMATYVTNLVVLIGLGLAIDYSLLVVYRYRTELASAGSREDAVVSHDGDRRPCRRLLGPRRRDRPERAPLRPGSLHPVARRSAGSSSPSSRSPASRRSSPSCSPASGRAGKPRARARRRRRVAAARPGRDRTAVGSSSCSASRSWCLLPRSRRRSRSRPARSPRSPAARSRCEASSSSATGSARGSWRRPQIVDRLRLLRAAHARARRAPRSGGSSTTTAPDREVQAVAYGKRSPYVDASGRYARVIVRRAARLRHAARRGALVGRLRNDLIPAARLPGRHDRRRRRSAARRASTSSRAPTTPSPGSSSPSSLVTFVTLAYAFRSLLLPLQAVLLNLLSVAAAYGLLVARRRARRRRAACSGSSRPDAIEAWVPIVLFALLFGLSMDYEVFIVAPMREARDAGRRQPAARSCTGSCERGGS